MEIFKDFWLFLKERKKFWMLPLMVILIFIGMVTVFAGGSALAPFIYSLF
ncbi:MAG: DUF5989 family protein [Cyclobacteriaceae bacterium]